MMMQPNILFLLNSTKKGDEGMRNPERLEGFYTELKRLHKEKFPDWRFGQLMINFLHWVALEKKCDPFFPEEDRMLRYLKEYAGESVEEANA